MIKARWLHGYEVGEAIYALAAAAFLGLFFVFLAFLGDPFLGDAFLARLTLGALGFLATLVFLTARLATAAMLS